MTRDEIISRSRAEGGMFIVIPSVVKLDTELPLSAQMLYGIITWKCNSYAYTWATNRELGEALGPAGPAGRAGAHRNGDRVQGGHEGGPAPVHLPDHEERQGDGAARPSP